MYDYDLFAVICHEGQIDNGHYTNFARFQEEVGTNSFTSLWGTLFSAVALVVPIR